MRDNNSMPVFRNMGRTEAGNQVTRTYSCKHTGQVKTLVKHVVRGGRNSTISRTPPRPLSTGFHTRDEKRKEAQERDAYRATLSPMEQLERLKNRPGESRREKARLLALISAPKVAEKKGSESVVNKKMTADEKANRRMRHAQDALQAQK